MTARAFEVSIIVSETERIVRTVIAHGSVQAALSSLRTLPKQTVVLRITCKPLCSIIDEEEPCCA